MNKCILVRVVLRGIQIVSFFYFFLIRPPWPRGGKKRSFEKLKTQDRLWFDRSGVDGDRRQSIPPQNPAPVVFDVLRARRPPPLQSPRTDRSPRVPCPSRSFVSRVSYAKSRTWSFARTKSRVRIVPKPGAILPAGTVATVGPNDRFTRQKNNCGFRQLKKNPPERTWREP